MEKEFMGYWKVNDFLVDAGHSDSQGSEFQTFSDEDCVVTESNGYLLEDINEINNLNIGEVWESKHYGTSHMIWRVK